VTAALRSAVVIQRPPVKGPLGLRRQRLVCDQRHQQCKIRPKLLLRPGSERSSSARIGIICRGTGSKVATLSLIWLVAASSAVVEESDQFVSGPIRSIAFAVHSYG
jgi:hypothetical protein